MLKLFMEQVVKAFGIKTLLLTLLLSTCTFTVVYYYTGPYESEKSIIGGLTLTFIAIALLLGAYREWVLGKDPNEPPKT
jgi:hypothetical protein